MNAVNKIIDIYYSLYSTSIVDVNKLTIENPEITERFNTRLKMINYMLDEIILGLDNIL